VNSCPGFDWWFGDKCRASRKKMGLRRGGALQRHGSWDWRTVVERMEGENYWGRDWILII